MLPKYLNNCQEISVVSLHNVLFPFIIFFLFYIYITVAEINCTFL